MKDKKELGEIVTIIEKMQELEEQQTSIFQYLGEMIKLLGETRIGIEVDEKCGERYNREKPEDGKYSRYGSQSGSLKLGIERIPIEVPRIKDNQSEKTFEPESYQTMRENAPGRAEDLYKILISGLKQREYKKIAQSFEESFGLSQSNVSKHFVEISEKILEEFENRSLAHYDFIAMFIDGKFFGSTNVMHCIGITTTGHKICLGFTEAATENNNVIKEMFERLINRGFKYDQGILVIADGSKGIKKATEEIFGKYALFQRCQWHKRENVVSYLSEEKKLHYRKRLQLAYEELQYDIAKSKLMQIHEELQKINRSAAQSLSEGLEETLTIHRLGLREELGKSLTTTNVIENVNNRLRQVIGRVTNWKNSGMLQRWVAAGLLEIEPGLRRIHNYQKLYLLRMAIQNSVGIAQEKVA